MYYESASMKGLFESPNIRKVMPKTTPTIYAVAAKAGVSISTVSRVLNTPGKVNEETRNAVLSAIEELGFVPKADARARAMRGTHRIGVLSPFFTAPSFVQRLRGVSDFLRPTNYELVVYTIDSVQRLNTYLETLPLTHNLDGLIVLSLKFDDYYARRLVELGLETVLVEYPHSVLSSVEIDDIAGGKMAAEYLLSKGHTHLGYTGDSDEPEYSVHPISLRLVGFRQRLAAAGIQLRDEDILLNAIDVEETRRHALTYLTRSDRPTAVFAGTDLQALGLLRAARDLGLRVPQDLAILGFDGLDVSDYVGLTTLGQHLEESGRVAAEILLSRINNENRSVMHVKLPLTLIERETV